MSHLSETGYLRLPEVLKIIPVCKTVWWEGIKAGKYPAGVKLSARCTAWRAEDIQALIERM
ncbi:phage regulatory protein, AlpA family [Citrifermentans bemidjiense Bem]|uniref:Phage regulatory protein, AlpA family n=2 Tax=Citrifermentans bemidjiense TaxID=225194 RepID=B5EC14_CITBB|nr:phage regulatory protein, AlpA family [Citrifermentans bemidjiense Bem]